MLMNAPETLPPQAAPTRPVHDEPLYEVVTGQKVKLPPMSIYASWIASRIDRRLGAHAEAHGLGTVVVEGVFILDAVQDLRRRPDVAFISAAKWPLDRPLAEADDWNLIPDLAIEVVGPNDLFQDVLAKMREYFRYGVGRVWIVLPADQEIYVYDSPTDPRVVTAADELDVAPLLPGLRLAVADLFQPRPQAPAPAQSTGA
jgi:Uma2 family endonuclease